MPILGAKLIRVYPGVRGLSVPITQGKTLRINITFQNIGNVTLDNVYFTAYIGDELTYSAGMDIATLEDYWQTERFQIGINIGAADSTYVSNLPPGGTGSAYATIYIPPDLPAGLYDVGIILKMNYQGVWYLADAYHEDDAIEIKEAPKPAASIVSVSYEEV